MDDRSEIDVEQFVSELSERDARVMLCDSIRDVGRLMKVMNEHGGALPGESAVEAIGRLVRVAQAVRDDARATSQRHLDELRRLRPLFDAAKRLVDKARACRDRPYLGCAMCHDDIENGIGDEVDAALAEERTDG